MQNKNGQCKEFHKHVSVNSKEIQLTSTGSEKKIWCPFVQDKLFCLWDKCEFVFTRPKDK